MGLPGKGWQPQLPMNQPLLFKLLVIGLVVFVLFDIAFLIFFIPIKIVASDSMAPQIRAGDVIFLDPEPGPIQPGEIITYAVGKKTITHRVVAIEENLLVTKGDNNQDVDPWKTPLDAVIGRPVLCIPKVGYALVFLRSPWGWLVLVFLPTVWVVVDELKNIRAALRKQTSDYSQ